MSDQNQTSATAIAAFSLWWGMTVALAKKNILTQQETMDGLDAALHWLESNQTVFPDQSAVVTARQLVETQMNILRGEMP